MFPTYRFDDLKTHKSITVGKTSYVWAGLFGVLYLWFKGGHGRMLPGLLLTTLCSLAIVGIVGGSSILSPLLQLIVIIAGVPVVLTVQSVRTMDLVRSSYRRRRWQVRRPD